MDTSWDTRETLLKRAGNPEDEISWKEFVSFYEKYIYQLIRRMNFSHHDTEEVVQDVFVKVWRKLADFSYDRSKGRFRGWLCVTTKNSALDFLRKAKCRGQSRELYESDMVELSVPDVEVIAEREWKLYLSNQAWNNIRSDYTQKTIDMFMRVTHGEPVAEVAKDLEVTENTIYNAKCRIVKRLQQEISKLEELMDI